MAGSVRCISGRPGPSKTSERSRTFSARHSAGTGKAGLASATGGYSTPTRAPPSPLGIKSNRSQRGRLATGWRAVAGDRGSSPPLGADPLTTEPAAFAGRGGKAAPLVWPTPKHALAGGVARPALEVAAQSAYCGLKRFYGHRFPDTRGG